MAIRKQQQLTVTKLTVRDFNNRKINPTDYPPGGGLAKNVVPFEGTITRMPFPPPFHTASASSRVWRIVDFSFVRDSAPESQLLIFKANGKIYKRQGGMELEIFPGKTSFSVLAAKPAVDSIANRLHVTDGVQYLIWDGWEWVTGGLTAPATPSTAFVAGSLTGTYNVCVTAVVIRGGVRIHESTRSATATVAPAAQNIRVTQPTLDSRATHWSVYVSEIAGAGNRMRRAATVAVTSTTTDISANPSSTSPFAPERNDKPQASRVLFQWKNRLGMGDRTNVDRFWFTAFEEVKAHLNGAPEESVPGRDSSSISDLVNGWTLPDRAEALRAGLWHENFAFLFSDRNGYAVQGEGGLLDGRALRDFFPLHTFPFGAAGPWSVVSTPHGLVILTPEKKLYLWAGGSEVADIGRDIQDVLDSLNGTDLFESEMVYWAGNSRDWLVFASPGLVSSTEASAQATMFIFDFSQPTGNDRGIWFHYLDSDEPTAVAVARIDGKSFLLVGADTGTVKQFDTECQPAHLDLTFKLGSVYLGSSVQSSTNCTAAIYAFAPDRERDVELKYLLLKHRLINTTDTLARTGTDPTITVSYDVITPEGSPSTVSLTLGSRLTTGAQRAWFRTSALTSGVGTRTKNTNLSVDWAGTTDKIANGGRDVFCNNQILMLGVAWKPLSVLDQ